MYKYTKLTQHLKHLIETGELKPHEKLPSLRDQAQHSGPSLMMVLNACQELEAQGVIY
ncbi:GntR family transcriptional regulator [Glaesserella parasuis]|nr:GntR family transcriptional regulator [Glaesserella parasuis]MDE4018077.1 GntR family transcriptional regulator [Glaesserella parasuis]MDO9834306.1 GntR family transcriptional regulator [Glaesserella parasuis]